MLVDVCLIMKEFEEFAKECDRAGRVGDFVGVGF